MRLTETSKTCHVLGMRRLFPVLFVALTACPGAPIEDAPCIELFPSECAQESECQLVEGFVINGDPGEECVQHTGDTVGLGCDAAGRDCLDVETLAAPADDPTDCYLFSDSCIPEGWVDCEDLSDIPEDC